MPDTSQAFEAAVEQSRALTERPNNATLLRMYALYKQATEGDAPGERPGFADPVARAKWDAWHALTGTASAVAQQQYIDLIATLD